MCCAIYTHWSVALLHNTLPIANCRLPIGTKRFLPFQSAIGNRQLAIGNYKPLIMKTFLALLLITLLLSFSWTSTAQDEPVRVVWQVTGFEISANLAERSLNVTATLNAKNIGRGQGSTFTVRLNSKANVKTASVAGSTATFRAVPETRGDL